MAPADLFELLQASGVEQGSIVLLDGPATPRHIRYVDLLQPVEHVDASVLPDAVIEAGGSPVMYVVRQDRLGDTGSDANRRLAELIRVLACRADARFLAVVRPGALDVYAVTLFDGVQRPVVSAIGEAVRSKLSGLLSGTAIPSSERAKRSRGATEQWLEALLFRLLSDAAQQIKRSAPNLTVQQVIGLVGRALFFRFLVDRRIVTEAEASEIAGKSIALEAMFSSEDRLIRVCQWMDSTFNGDLLSLDSGSKDYLAFTRGIGSGIEEVCRQLSNIQYKALGGQLPLNWGGIQFQHVPVDVLSQVYEEFAHEFLPDLAHSTSIHYTPRRLAEIVLDGAFTAIGSCPPDQARVLDPSAGGGVFLVLALRRLVAERWQATGVRPARDTIRKILLTQIVGLDTNVDALNIAALSLYLAALELDPMPSPLTDLKFEKLIGTVLHPVDEATLTLMVASPGMSQRSSSDSELGSLSAVVLERFKSQFDVVVGNPPWTGFKGKAGTALNMCLAKLIASDVGDNGAAIRARYGSPDVAFLLASRVWAKPGAAIGFALHGRLLFQPKAFELRRHIFGHMRITGIMNFAALRQDPRIWGTNDAPFLLLVARNEPVGAADSFYFISPKREQSLSALGQFRVDPVAATPVLLNDVKNDPLALKALYKGGPLGFELLTRIRSTRVLCVADQISREGLKLTSGYQSGKEHNQTQSADHMRGMPEVGTEDTFGLQTGEARRYFNQEYVQWPRHPDIYKGPLLLFRESPKLERASRGALFCEENVIYTESLIGLRLPDRDRVKPLGDLLYVVSYSDLLLYYQLLSSPKFGVERDSALQSDFEAFPLIDCYQLDETEIAEIAQIAAKLRRREPCWDDVDRLVAKLYDLSPWDEQLIKDTLASELPFSKCVLQANLPPSDQQVVQFARILEDILRPFAEHDVEAITVDGGNWAGIEGWRFLRVVVNDSSYTDLPLTDTELACLSRVANSYWASRMTAHLGDGQLIVGVIDQSRYWSPTQARVLALDGLQNSPLFV